VSSALQLVFTALPGLPLVQPGDDLAGLIQTGLAASGLELRDGDVLVVAQKVVSKAEGRLVCLNDVVVSDRARALADEVDKDPRLVQVILGESSQVVRAAPGVLVVEHRLGFVSANAGVDHSNVAGIAGRESEPWVLLLPKDPDASAQDIGERLARSSGAEIGVLVIDSHGRAWRVGTEGVTIGVYHFPALLDLRGHPDLFGEPLRITQVGLADEIAAGASALMGQADEGRPIIHVRGLPYRLQDGSLAELIRPRGQDLFR
jgi:coenzyme F420-0:L-glutamate ligase / coenzyme F420-1:gamma-L-glutamate ligase